MELSLLIIAIVLGALGFFLGFRVRDSLGRPAHTLGDRPVPPEQSPALDEDLRALLLQGRKIEAVKRYRQQTGVGLAQAKNAVDALEEKLKGNP
jgi:large subunit ribosomal protein L7/L12